MEVNRNQLLAERKNLDNKIQVVTEKYNLTSNERDQLLSKQSQVASKTDAIDQEMTAEKERIAAEKAREEAEAKKLAEAQRKAAEKEKQAQQVKTASSTKKSSSEVSSSSSSTSSTTTTNSGGWARPAGGPITSEFGYRIHPILGYNRLHAGTDIGGGGPITAAKAGTVTVAGYHNSYGNYVKIDHGNGISTLYAHMKSDLRVSAGQSVSQGQQIGTMGTTGSSTGVHLHFEVHKNGTPVNPRNYVNF